MSSNSLSLPVDIPWERWCVSEDLIDLVPCDTDRPAKWQSSIAVFRYVPEDDYQGYSGRKITYLKVVCTISGFQPKRDEVQGVLDNLANSFEAGSLSQEGLEKLLSSYRPCNEAILQVTVAPPPGSGISINDYPYVMDFQPKKREMYEAVTDTNEIMSRSLESLNVRKSAGTTNSQEVLDIDQGYNVSGSGQGQGPLGGGGGSFGYGQQEQKGTKHLGTDESSAIRTTDESHERRETVSHTTQITQLRHLLDSYHLGTNRVVFFIQPRLHTLQEPSGFVTGPRPIEGIQEFFLIINQPKDQKEFCVDVRLDTGHYLEQDVKDYDRSQTVTIELPTVSANAPIQGDGDLNSLGTIYKELPKSVPAYKIPYEGHSRTVKDSTSYIPKEGYIIDIQKEEGGYKTLSNLITSSDPSSNVPSASSDVKVSPDGTSLTINGTAISQAYFKGRYENVETLVNTPVGLDPVAWAVWRDADETIDSTSSSVTRKILIFLVSKDKIAKTDQKEKTMFITTRGLCCCPLPKIEKEGIVYLSSLTVEEAGTNTQKANALQTAMRQEMLQSLVSARRTEPKPLAETPLLTKMLLPALLQNPVARILLSQPCSDAIPEKLLRNLSKTFRKNINQITRLDLLTIDVPALARGAGLDQSAVYQLKAAMLTTPFKTPVIPKQPKVVLQAKAKSRKQAVAKQRGSITQSNK